jgi:hypothetical protein
VRSPVRDTCDSCNGRPVLTEFDYELDNRCQGVRGARLGCLAQTRCTALLGGIALGILISSRRAPRSSDL